jgi:hypothetical protein
MKAEHRKELETNLLADRMGSIIQRMKGGPQRRTIFYWFLLLLVVVIAVVAYYYFQGDRAGAVQRWIALDFGEIEALRRDTEESNPKKAAELELWHYYLTKEGVLNLGSDPKNALRFIVGIGEVYDDLSKKQYFKDDPQWAAEVDYALAVIEETRAAVDIKKLDSAKLRYEQVANDHKKTTFGDLAAKRKEVLADKEKFKQIKEFYIEMNAKLYPGGTLKSLDEELRKEREKPKTPLQQ